jgi:tetratricopeptide (TPR) repeat protein
MRTVLFTAITLGALAAAVAGARTLRARQDARSLTHEADLALHSPLERAAEIGQLPATRARMLLEQAESLYDAPEQRALLAYAQALEEYQKDRLPQADRALARARQAASPDRDLPLLDAALAHAQGRAGDAFAKVRALLAREPQHDRARVMASDLAAESGDPDAALALLEPLIAQHPKLGSLYNRRGLAREALGRTRDALADFTHAIELDSALPQPYLNRGRVLRGQGRAKDAEEAFSQALERADDADAWLGRGLSRVAQGDLTGGRLDVEQARDRAPGSPGPLIALADLDAMTGQLSDALTRYRAALALAPEDAVAWLKLGNTLTRDRQLNDARDAYQHAVELDPGLGAAHNGLGAALMGLGQDDAAEQALATAAALDTQDPNPLLNLALLRTRHGDLRGAADARAQAQGRAN